MRNFTIFGIVLMSFFLAIVANAGETITFYHTDQTGTPIAISDQNGNKVWEADYKPFGEEHAITQSIENNRRFVGKEKDTETGLNYFGARYLSSSEGRFLAPDPVRAVNSYSGRINREILINPQRHNTYAYSLNNPYRYVDPDGREVESTYSKSKGIVTTTDLDTGVTVTMEAESGGKPFGAPIENGNYDILDHPDKNKLRLEANDSNYGNDIHDPTGRDLFRLHEPGRTVGCIAAKCTDEWESTRDVVRNTSSTTVEVNSKSRNPFAPKKETVKKFGTLKVTE